jgi:hypothetical protein
MTPATIRRYRDEGRLLRRKMSIGVSSTGGNFLI